MFAAIWETAKASSCARKLGSRAETIPLTPFPATAGSSRRRSRIVVRSSCSSAARSSARALRRGPSAPARVVEQLGTALERGGGGGLDRADVWMDGDAVRVRRRLRGDRGEPADLVDEADDRAGGGAEPGRAVGGREERPLERGRRRRRPLDRLLAVGGVRPPGEEPDGVGAQPPGERPAGGDRGLPQPVARRRRPEHDDREQRGARRKGEARQAIRDRACRRGQRDRQDEHRGGARSRRRPAPS